MMRDDLRSAEAIDNAQAMIRSGSTHQKSTDRIVFAVKLRCGAVPQRPRSTLSGDIRASAVTMVPATHWRMSWAACRGGDDLAA